MNQDDHLLIKKILAGDKSASKILYEQNEPYWFRLCLRYGRNRSEAQDIFQEGVVKVFQVLDKFDIKRGTFGGWSNRVIVNEALKYLKRHQWQESFEDLSLTAATMPWPESIIEKITARELIELVQKLPLGYRVVFNMYEIEGYSHREIAETLGISVGTSKSQLYKAKRTLQAQLKLLL
ncbi:MAG: DNA-directed RNA polymerase sigma-70 factor [Saprospiraceae bacterium]|nr:MAG: DNA-directed RNA polymerase sigma-70 factor [Saprospiraceae bacterium]